MRLNALRPGCWLFPCGGKRLSDLCGWGKCRHSFETDKGKVLFLRFRAKAPLPGTVGARGAFGGGRRRAAGRRGAAGRGLLPAAASEKQNSPCGHCLGARPAPGAHRPLTAPSRGPGGAGREVRAFPWDENGFPWDGTAFPWAVCAAKWPANGDEMARKPYGKARKGRFFALM